MLSAWSDERARQASVAYLFSRVGAISLASADGAGVNEVIDAAIEAGAEEVDVTDDGEIEVRTLTTRS